jgi:hypothetical protein
MGFLMKAAAWTVGLMAIVIAGFIVWGAYSVPEGEVQLLAQKVCPPPVSVPARAADAPVDDIAGIRPGFTLKDVRLTLDCRDESYNYRFERLWHTPLTASVKTRQRLVASRAQERLSLGIVGPYEQEVVYGVFQDIAYARTTVTATPDDMVRDLGKQYGQPHEVKQNKLTREVWWLYDPVGKPLMAPSDKRKDMFSAVTDWVTGSWETAQCKKYMKLDPATLQRWDAECGLSILAQIDIDPEDETRVRHFRMVIVDQARLGSAVGLYRAQTAKAAETSSASAARPAAK